MTPDLVMLKQLTMGLALLDESDNNICKKFCPVNLFLIAERLKTRRPPMILNASLKPHFNELYVAYSFTSYLSSP